MKTLKQISLLCLFWMIGMSVSAYDFSLFDETTGSTIYYNITSDVSPRTVEVAGAALYQNLMHIPRTVTYNDFVYGVTGVADNAFNGSSIKEFWVEDTSGKIFKRIGKNAFKDCVNLDLDWDYGHNLAVTIIDEGAFSGCTSLTEMRISAPNIGDNAFKGCTALRALTFLYGVENIGKGAFQGCTRLIALNAKNVPLTYGGYIQTATDLPNSVVSIGDGAYSGCKGLKTITMPNSVTNIGKSAFANCTRCTSVTISNSVTSIEQSTFSGCTGLTSVTIPNSVTSIGESAFNNCTSLTSISLPNSVTSIGGSAFKDCTNLTSISLPNSVTSIGGSAFYKCTSLTSISLPNSVSSIGGSAFYNCSSLSSISLPNSVTSIGESAFQKCVRLASITLPNSVTSIEHSTFDDCSGLESVTIPNSVTGIGNRAFYNCSKMTSITIPNSVTSIGNYAFYGCSKLASMTIPNSVTSIGDYAFYGCSKLTSITIPNSVTSIGSYAFQKCSLTSLTIPNSVVNIGFAAFTPNLTSITVEDGNTNYDSREGCNAIIEKSSNTLIIGCKNTIIPNSVTSIGKYAFRGCGFTSLTIPNSVTSIGDYAFSGCSLTSITIPNSVTSIGQYAFGGCTSLTSLIIPNSVTSIGYSAFYGIEISVILTSKVQPEPLGASSVLKVYYPKNGAYSVSGSQYIPYTNIAVRADGSVAAETLDDWSELKIKDAIKEYIVPVELNYYFLGASYSRSFNNHEWQAWYIPVDVPFSSLSARFEVAKFSDTQTSANEIEIESVTSGTLTANTPYLVRLKDGKATGEYSIVADESAGLKETVENEVNIGSNYKLKTTYRELSGAELKGKYALSEGKFKKAGDSATLKPFRVYLEPVTTGAADVLDLVMDGTTDITLTPSSVNGAETIYNLNGQAVGEDYKGIVIKNGKKVFKN